MSEADRTGTDERAYLHDVADATGLDVSQLRIERIGVDLGAALGWVSGLRYGEPGAAELVFLHGGGQNAHTWDLTAAALGCPAVAIDLPGHGASSWLSDSDYAPRKLARPVDMAVQQLAPGARTIVGMSLGGMVGLALLEDLPLLRQLVLVDVTPGSTIPQGSRVREIMRLPPMPFEELVGKVRGTQSRRSLAALRHSVWHGTRPFGPEGLRRWRSDPALDPGSFADLWPVLQRHAGRVTAVLAGQGSFVPEHDRKRLAGLLPAHRMIEVPQASHSVQGSRPAELAEALTHLLDHDEPRSTP